MSWLSYGVFVLAAGCGGRPSSLMPIREKAQWTYVVNGKLISGVEELSVVGRASVGASNGFVLRGPMGQSRVAWQGSQLVASELAGTTFNPPIPILDTNQAEKLPDWKGEVRAYGTASKGIASVAQTRTTFTLSGRKYPALAVSVTLKHGARQLETVITYAETLGIAKLTEHANGEFFSSMEYLAGP